MSGGSSTIRPERDRTTYDSQRVARRLQLEETITDEWKRTSQPDLVTAIERHPQLLSDQSLLLNLALEEYKSLRAQLCDIDLRQHCRRFEKFGSSLERSVFRQLEIQEYLDEHPELLGLFPSPQWPEIGEEFCGFVVQEELGRGGISRVYLCEERDVGNRLVVVKISPRPSIEASVLGRLDHANIIPIHSTGRDTDRDLSYICMPYRGRQTLSDVIDLALHRSKEWPFRNEPELPASEQSNFTTGRVCIGHASWNESSSHYYDRAIDIVVSIGEALDFSHRTGIIHGDIKPSNILLTREGEPLLLDFNLSQDLSNPAEWCGGTLPYMPPEHLTRIAQDPVPNEKPSFDVRTDVYSFGAVVYELFTGSPPMAGEIVSGDQATTAKNLLQRLQSDNLQFPSTNLYVSSVIESTILKCLSTDPQKRPTSIESVVAIFRGEQRLIAVLRRKAKSRPRSVAVAFGAVVFLCAALVGYAATRPPAFLAAFNKGISLASAGDATSAEKYFRHSIAKRSDYAPARLELARTLIAQGRPDVAVEELNAYVSKRRDLQCLALLGYCHNMCRNHILAIPCYLEVLEEAHNSAAVLNNLSASYRAVPKLLPPDERLSRPEQLLARALGVDEIAIAIRANLIRLELAKTTIDPKHDPIGVVSHVMFLKNQAPDDKWAKAVAAPWYAVVRQRRESSNNSESGFRHELDEIAQWLGPSLAQMDFGALSAQEIDAGPSAPQGRIEPRTSGALLHYFIEPR